MIAHSFIEKTTTAVQNFFQQGLSIEILRGLPDETQLEEFRAGALKRKFFASLVGETAAPAYLIPYHVARIHTGRSTSRIPRETEENGTTKVTFTREAEAYRIKYLILAAPITTVAGQHLLSSLIALLFDQSQFDLERDTVRLIEPVEQSDDSAAQCLRQSGIDLAPLYFFHAELKISTSTILAKDSVVHTRQISLGEPLR